MVDFGRRLDANYFGSGSFGYRHGSIGNTRDGEAFTQTTLTSESGDVRGELVYNNGDELYVFRRDGNIIGNIREEDIPEGLISGPTELIRSSEPSEEGQDPELLGGNSNA
jgi:hypothetical protein